MADHRRAEQSRPLRPPCSERGSSMVEMALIFAITFPMLLGVAGLGMQLSWTLGATQVTRDVAHMYALGTDFSLAGAQSIATTLSRDFSLTASGNAELILSQIMTVYQADCTAQGLKSCPNANQSVFTQRLILGNPSLRASAYGTPPSNYLDSRGYITPTNYLQQSSLIANGFSAVMSLQDGQVAYLVEGYYSMPQLNLLNQASNSGGYYVRFVF